MKKLLSLLLSSALMIGIILMPVSALSATQENEMIQAINALGIMLGDESGDMQLGRSVSRAEFATMAVKSTSFADLVSTPSVAPYPDVPRNHWSAPYVAQSIKLGFVSGYTDGTFRPNNQITLAEGTSIILKVLGYTPQATPQYFVGTYPQAQMALAEQFSLLDDMSITKPSDMMTRRDAMILFYNALTAPTVHGQPLLVSLGYPLTQSGEVDLLALINGAMDGPIIAVGNWQSKIGFPIHTGTIYQDGKKVSQSSIQEYDVIYWSDSMRSIWVYDERVSGTIQGLMPTAASPTTVQLAGQNYPITEASATYALSTLGSYELGDAVSLLLGRDGTVVGVADTTAATSSRVGLITSINQGGYTGTGGSYTADTMTILATDGKNYSYPVTNSQYDPGDVVRVSTQSSGGISITRAVGGAISGTVSSDGKTLGKLSFADDVEILDVSQKHHLGLRIYPSRLAGVNISKENVEYAERNENGDILRLVLNDVTGDVHQYGIVTDVQVIASDLYVSSAYTVLIDGSIIPIQFQGARYTTEKSPAKVAGSLQSPGDISTLRQAEIDYIEGQIVTADSNKHILSDDVQIYHKIKGDYFLSNLKKLDTEDVTLTAWYDKNSADGGRIRIIIAE